MRVKLLRRNEASTVLLAYPATIEEYHQALNTLGRPARPAAGHIGTDPGREGQGRAHGCYVVTTAEQRHRWGLPDLSVHGRARMADESRAFDVLGDRRGVVEGRGRRACRRGGRTLTGGRRT